MELRGRSSRRCRPDDRGVLRGVGAGRAAEFCGYVRGTTLEDVLYALPRAWNEGDSPVAAPVLAELPAVAR